MIGQALNSVSRDNEFPEISEIEEVSDFINSVWCDLYGFTITLRDGSIMNYFVFSKRGEEKMERLKESYDNLCK